ncbi:hypothetical protein BDP27DRAFT_1428068 [Rhodocollybia butyracea]|uniref:Uncharacterized protein n=1 Tax=Rhodocollybia butyracea TaxID=206335 RepID=A0A9P5PEB1_9AGAR|nr:hypothetical protein BDP27DRAFT_1428068 [Rhodocollybia butyracea]
MAYSVLQLLLIAVRIGYTYCQLQSGNVILPTLSTSTSQENAPSVPLPSHAPSASSTPVPSPNSISVTQSSPTAKAIGGGVMGAGLLFLIFLTCWWIRKRRRKQFHPLKNAQEVITPFDPDTRPDAPGPLSIIRRFSTGPIRGELMAFMMYNAFQM